MRAGVRSQFENWFTEIFSGTEAGSYSRLSYFVHHSTLGLRATKKKKRVRMFGGFMVEVDSLLADFGLRVESRSLGVGVWGVHETEVRDLG